MRIPVTFQGVKGDCGFVTTFVGYTNVLMRYILHNVFKRESEQFCMSTLLVKSIVLDGC